MLREVMNYLLYTECQKKREQFYSSSYEYVFDVFLISYGLSLTQVAPCEQTDWVIPWVIRAPNASLSSDSKRYALLRSQMLSKSSFYLNKDILERSVSFVVQYLLFQKVLTYDVILTRNQSHGNFE